jgi:hypothetical protein
VELQEEYLSVEGWEVGLLKLWAGPLVEVGVVEEIWEELVEQVGLLGRMQPDLDLVEVVVAISFLQD